jgi:probable F420-dependent oxidoreductase
VAIEAWQNLGFTDPALLIPLARTAEDLGFAGVSLPEHLATPETIVTPNPYVAGGGSGYAPDTPFPDPWVTFAALAAVTERLRFVANVSIVALRPLVVAAKAISTAAVLSGDRVVLGVGVGWLREEFEALGVDFSTRGRRTDEVLALLPRLLGGEVVGASGEHHRFEPLSIAPVPARPVPVIVGGISDAALARAARADGWVGVNFEEDVLMPILDRLRVARERAGTADRPHTVMVSRPPTFSAEVARRYDDAGVSAIVNRPTVFTVGPDASLDEHRAAMREFLDLLG